MIAWKQFIFRFRSCKLNPLFKTKLHKRTICFSRENNKL